LFPFQDFPIDHDGYEEFATRGGTLFERTPLESADFAVLPFDGSTLLKPADPSHSRALLYARNTVSEARRHDLRMLIVANIDSTSPMPLPQESIVVLRPSLLASSKRSNEYALPAWHDDLFTRYSNSELRVRPWTERPSVGFCGLAGRGKPTVSRRIKILLQRLGVDIPHSDGIWLRAASMNRLARCERVETSFVVRDQYFGGPSTKDQDKQRARQEYVDNILDNDYSLCVRGWGNHSFRTYEALSLGRPLLFLDTDCVLPLEELIGYEEIAVRVPESDLMHMPERLLSFHHSLDESTFAKTQRRAREVWEDLLSPMGFYSNLSRILLERFC